jgi:hypothetical protein
MASPGYIYLAMVLAFFNCPRRLSCFPVSPHACARLCVCVRCASWRVCSLVETHSVSTMENQHPGYAVDKMNLNYLNETVLSDVGESTLGSTNMSHKRGMSQTEFSPALDSEVTPPNQLR